MSIELKILEEILKNSSGEIRFQHHNLGRLLPFFTREPERAKFENGFSTITGSLARISINKIGILSKGDKLFKEDFSDSFDLSSIENKDKFLKLFSSSALDEVYIPKLLAYKKSSGNQSSKGESTIAEFLNHTFKLNENDIWVKFIQNDETHNLYEKIIMENLRDLKDEKLNLKKFVSIDMPENIIEYFNHDLNNLIRNKTFFIKNVDVFFRYYYFFIISQIIMNIDSFDDFKKKDLYFALDTENISGSRQTNNRGYALIKEKSADLLANVDVLDYLNILIPGDKFYNLSQLTETNFKYSKKLATDLSEFLIDFLDNNSDENRYLINENGIKENVKLLRNELTRKLSKETKSRYPKSFEAITTKYFVKRRGRLGNILNVTEETLLVLTAAIVGPEKMLIKNVIFELSNRGITLDHISERELISVYEKMNILEKLSDSGDAQYVKPIL
ncbi:DNA phosphorothioation-dependent restriction protein DptG [Dellaglioa algida]|uniref:DNA phosphorothioation-dependent restriction protein DptG n=1 Tax=Dellaglioa algida TaxID=105612 RepID=A0A5C6M980_9LACO|nr:DNA phosphorothioation-dependent restriction protein DptG [Dellaglioa algida]MDK1716318.1 DNA phosphorothioation-dependent restriction protein DptG [Dellaglioa algida]MDK1720328.1 DNA phosphorothioation-dependent restriction protein DptG [Dellaglioa algida]MDK1721259.1 DNA phosphorothioation-dependent restriction protein DptG [Dellaglioa algida]MDK1723469.1 DNA phosphorothioation-dependent restriction protein DptG [Dellaglioa algida]MDK1725103.1 DNA phosphorothioation-dependent restriction 